MEDLLICTSWLKCQAGSLLLFGVTITQWLFMLISAPNWQPQRLLMNKDSERNQLICNECIFLVDSDH